MDICYQDFSNICRICLHSGNLQQFSQLKMMGLFKFLTNIEVNENDALPENVCRFCLNQLEEVALFIDKCKRNDVILKEISINFKKQFECDELDNGNDSDICEHNDSTLLKSEPLEVSENGTLTNLLKSNVNKNKCSTCGEDLSQCGWKRHYRFNTKCRPKDCICPVCEKSFYPRYKLTIHLRSHKKNTSYECPECSKIFASAEKLRKHAMIHKGVKPFICAVCGKGFLRKRSLDEHMNFHTGKTPYICVYCGEGFKRFTDHAAHIYHTHNINTKQVPKHKRKYTEKRVHLNIECKTCGKIFASRSGFANHQLAHKGIKKFLCNFCGRKFTTNAMLQCHIRTHTGEKPFQCKECGKSFRQSYCLNVHMSQHVSYKSFACPNCDKRYLTRSRLNNHLLIHSDDKALECPKCSRRFCLKSTLHNHLLNHRDEKPYKLNHRDEKPYKCNLCNMSFWSPCNLNSHARTHSGEKPYLCVVCGKRLAHPQTLKVHMRQHTGEVPYMCTVCNRGFYDSSNFRKHFNRHHGSNRDVNNGIINSTENND